MIAAGSVKLRRLARANSETAALNDTLSSAGAVRHAAGVVPEAPLEQTEHGLLPDGEGWFAVNARDAQWRHAPGRGAICRFEVDVGFPQLGFRITVLQPGEPMAMYHWEADQEDFLVVSGEALLIVEGEERQLRPWDFVHCPAGTRHVIVGAGNAACVVVGAGARDNSLGSEWGAYTVDETAIRHGAGVAEETSDQHVAYGAVAGREPTRYRDGWLPD
ncbi:MAG TPA: cupin domain-containing protein [Gaiellaceae bacterium]|nr:cupin domain-containing protein [Gaiellaceae bacterium]